MTAALQALRALRFRVWALLLGLRLRRLGGRLVLEVAATPRFLGLPQVEIDGHPGTLTLRIGRDVKLGRGLVIDLAQGLDGTIELGDRVSFQNGVRLQPWGGAIRLADGVQVRDRCELKSAGELRIGRRAVLGRTTTVHCDVAITFGAHVGLAERVTVIDSDHGFDGSDTFFLEQPIRSSPVVLADNVFLATNVVVLRGTSVGESSVAAAGSVLNGGDFPARHVIAGTPARTLKPLGG
jgi:acetyltransferase-like isoleucine patch superfamily enzyme